MYQDWITHTWSCVQGECPHKCDYCYVKKGHFTKDNPAYKGEPRIAPGDLNLNLGRGKTIFVCHMNDLFANGVSIDITDKIIKKCKKYPDNTYVLQTKNPRRLANIPIGALPKKCMIGTTIETNRTDILCKISEAPFPMDRATAMRDIRSVGFDTFLTIEPIMDFDVKEFLELLEIAKPRWINIGADSKNCDLIEPTWEKVQELIAGIRELGIEIKEKSNLDRLKNV